MLAEGEQELICDFAETYHIYNIRALPARLAGTLAAGLGDNSRIKLKLSGEKYPRELVTAAIIADRLTTIQCDLFGIDKRKAVFLCDLLFPGETQDNTKADVFASPEEFRAAYDRIIKGGE